MMRAVAAVTKSFLGKGPALQPGQAAGSGDACRYGSCNLVPSESSVTSTRVITACCQCPDCQSCSCRTAG